MEYLANPFWPTLTTDLRRLAIGDGDAVRFHPDVNVFAAVPDHADEVSWKALAGLLAPGESAVISRARIELPDDWETEEISHGVQYLAPPGTGREPRHRVIDLGEADSPEIADLAAATHPGPYRPGTIRQGGFIGIREFGDHGRLLSVAGIRCQFAGAVEISTVCTAEDSRGRGYASTLVLELVRRIESGGRRAFLHTGAANPARALYEQLGFELVGEPDFALVRPRADRS